jgi:hypothetical protein
MRKGRFGAQLERRERARVRVVKNKGNYIFTFPSS